jgi:hypothetical protein
VPKPAARINALVMRQVCLKARPVLELRGSGQLVTLFRLLSATLLSAAVTFSLVTASGCGTNAVGVEDCRDIEEARCRAGESCGLVDDVAACQRFYRDHCLHGLMTEPTNGASVEDCVRAIEAAGRCAAQNPESSLSDCGDEPVPEAQPGVASACDVVAYPERTLECGFLTDTPPESGTGGQPATGMGGAADEPDEPAAGAGGQPAAAGAAQQ